MSTQEIGNDHVRREHSEMLESKSFDMFLQIIERIGKLETIMTSNHAYMQSFERRQDLYESKVDERFKPIEAKVEALTVAVTGLEGERKPKIPFLSKVLTVSAVITIILGLIGISAWASEKNKQEIERAIIQMNQEENSNRISNIEEKSNKTEK